MLYRQKSRLIGVDITAKTLTVLTLGSLPGALMPNCINRIGTACCTEHLFDAPARQIHAGAQALKDAYAQSGIKQRNAALALPSTAVMSHIMPLERSLHTQEMYYYIQHALQTQHGMASDPLQMDFQIIGDHDSDPALLDVFVVTARQSHIQAYIALFKEAGLRLKVIDMKTHAIEQAYPFIMSALSAVHNIIGIVEIDDERISFYVLTSGKICYKEEQNLFLDTQYNRLDADHSKRVCDYLDHHIQLFYTSVSDKAIDCLYLTGISKNCIGLADTVFYQTGISTQPLIEALIKANAISKTHAQCSSIGLWTACGLAMRTGSVDFD